MDAPTTAKPTLPYATFGCGRCGLAWNSWGEYTAHECKAPGGEAVQASDPVNHPTHYADVARVECIEIIEDLGSNFHVGCALKYLWRAGRKDKAKEVEDLKKAVFYINRRIDLLEGKAGKPGGGAK